MDSLKKIIMEEEGNIPLNYAVILHCLLRFVIAGITFQPNINNKSKHLGANDKSSNGKYDRVFDRLYEKSKEYREKHHQRIQYAEQYDPSSGALLTSSPTHAFTYSLAYRSKIVFS